MSYEELSGHAQDIYRKAVEEDLMDRGYYPDGDGGFTAPSYGGYDQEMVDQDVADSEGKFSDVPGLFSPFESIPDPAGFDEPIADLVAVMNKLSPGAVNDPIAGTVFAANIELTDMTDAAGYLEEWDGLAAMAFVENFANPFRDRTSNQFLVAGVLKGALEAEKEMWEKVRHDIDEIAHDTQNALEHYADCGSNDWSMAFTVVGAVVAIAAVPVTGGASLALAAVGAGTSIAGAAAGSVEEPELKMGAESAEGVINEMREAIGKLKEYITEAEQKIIDAMENANNSVVADREFYVAKRPRLADATDKNVQEQVGQPDD